MRFVEKAGWFRKERGRVYLGISITSVYLLYISSIQNQRLENTKEVNTE